MEWGALEWGVMVRRRWRGGCPCGCGRAGGSWRQAGAGRGPLRAAGGRISWGKGSHGVGVGVWVFIAVVGRLGPGVCTSVGGWVSGVQLQ